MFRCYAVRNILLAFILLPHSSWGAFTAFSPLPINAPTKPGYPKTSYEKQYSTRERNNLLRSTIVPSTNLRKGTISIQQYNDSNAKQQDSLTRPNLLSRIRRFFNLRRKNAAVAIRRTSLWLCLVASLLFCFKPLPEAWAAGTGGRVGGSFGSSSRSLSAPSMGGGRSFSSPQYYSPRLSPSRFPIHGHPSTTRLYGRFPQTYSSGTSARPRTVLVLGTGAVVALKVADKYVKQNDGYGGEDESFSSLGPGFSIASLTISSYIPNRDDPNSILTKLRRIALESRADTRQGIQNLIAEVSLELLRAEGDIQAAEFRYMHVRTESNASREFNRQSIEHRTKFDRETFNKVGDKTYIEEDLQQSVTSSTATEAIVTLLICIEGDSMKKLPPIRSRDDLKKTLQILASDVQVDECLLSAEVLWAPEQRSDILTREDVIYKDYPSLFPL